MKNQKRKNVVVILGMSCLLVLGMPSHVNAEADKEYDNESISVQYVNLGRTDAKISISGRNASCYGKVSSRSGRSCSLTVTLQKKSSTGWTNVKSWSKSATASCEIKANYTLSKKGSYRVKAVGKCEGESRTQYSTTKSY